MLAVGHPAAEMLQKNFGTFVGEDIELCNRSLSQASQSIRGQTEVFRLPLTLL